MTSEIQLTCGCGAIELRIHGDPVACAYCHCASCRDFYGLPVLAATAWKRDEVEVTRGVGHLGQFTHPTMQMQRYYCTACGETMFGTNRLGFKVVRNAFLARAFSNSLPSDFKPKFHLFYSYREFDVSDDLPKYLEGRDGPMHSTD